MKNILLIFTGGTIGSKAQQGIIDTHPDAGFKLLSLFREGYERQADISFDVVSPLQLLSENLHPHAWRQLIDAIEARDLSHYDGIIVTHGTDTLAFSASLLGVYFHALQLPLLLVSSDLPLDDPHANGLNNFMCAVEFIHQQIATGCFVAYQNPGQAMAVHIATRLSSCLPLSSHFISVNAGPLLHFADGHFEAIHPLEPVKATPFLFTAMFARILLIRPYPGLNYSHLNLAGVDVVLHDLYHSGTACVSEQWGKQHHLIDFARHCQHSEVPLYLAPSILTENAYSSTHQLMECGAQMIWNTSLETAYAKLLLAYGNHLEASETERLLSQNIAHECIATVGFDRKF